MLHLCPDGFKQLINGFCIRKCPFGWEDIGVECLKPVILRREHEIFTYKFAYDIEDEKFELKSDFDN